MRPGADAEHPWRSPVAEFDRDELFVRPDWQKRAACRGLGTADFFPGRGDNRALARAKAICATCPVRETCLEFGMSMGSHESDRGVWGGMSTMERRELRRRRKAVA